MGRSARKRKARPMTWASWWFVWMKDVLGAALWSQGIVDPGRIDQEVGEIWRQVKGGAEQLNKSDQNGRAIVTRTVARASSIIASPAPAIADPTKGPS